MTRAELIPLVKEIAEAHELEFRLVDAIVSVESSYLPEALRYEPQCPFNYSVKFYAKHNKVSEATEQTLQHFSYGLMQMMGFKARELAFIDPFRRLLDPRRNLTIGCKLLANLVKKYPILDDVISSYNGGSPLRRIGGGYGNQAYIDKVKSIYSANLRVLPSP